uniref:hypothetical protein n=1 Tax=Butyrivibrio sp. TaxID=28121 RepID=UPI0025F0AAC6
LPEDAALTITPAYVTLTSGTSSKTYDGTALTNPEVTQEGTYYERDGELTWNVTGTQTEVGSSDNTFTILINGDEVIIEEPTEDEEEVQLESSIGHTMRRAKNDGDFDQVITTDNYIIRLAYGTLTVTSAPTPTPPTPTPTPSTTTTTTTYTTTVITPAPTPAVLGATREEVIAPVTPVEPETPEVLGESRTRQTGDESKIPGRILIIMICAGAIATIMMTNRKKEEEQ